MPIPYLTMANDNISSDASGCDSLEATSPSNLNELLVESEENDECLIHIPHSPYIDRNSIANVLQPKKDNFSILSLNARRLGARFNELSLLVAELKEIGFTFGVIFIQET